MTQSQDSAASRAGEFAYEVQLRLFEQLTTISVAGAGLTITLIGSVMKDIGLLGWLSVIWFGLAAICALPGQFALAQQFDFTGPPRRTYRITAVLAVIFIGMGIGALGTGVVLAGG
jgi:hypothetical protein